MKANRNGFNTFDQEISGQVRAEIARANRTKRDVATALGMAESVFLRKCRGEVAFTTGELARVAEVLGTTATNISALAEQRYMNREVMSA